MNAWLAGNRFGGLDCRFWRKGGTLWLKDWNGMGDVECFGILRFAQDDSKNGGGDGFQATGIR
jgi:hypothetical protein